MIEIVRYAFFNTYVFKTHHVENPNTLNSAQIANQAKWPTLPDVLKEAEIMINIKQSENSAARLVPAKLLHRI